MSPLKFSPGDSRSTAAPGHKHQPMGSHPNPGGLTRLLPLPVVSEPVELRRVWVIGFL
jgi:hypothetical protein